jgi:transcriptional regulator with XRE-family HTH domain
VAGDEGVITMVLMGKIRAMRMREGKSISEIARLTSLSRNTIKKWLKVPQGTQPLYRHPILVALALWSCP